jgi:dihydroorotate dehydrogenase
MPALIGFFYRHLLKPFLFLFDAEAVHDNFLKIGQFLGRFRLTRAATRFLFAYKNKCLQQIILGISFPNPVGLSAGFDKDAKLTDIISEVGFGFDEVGSITGEPCDGNPRPRLWRLPAQKSLVVHYGLKNEGCETVAARLKNKHFKIPIGTNIAKTNNVACAITEAGISDYAKAFAALKDIGDYFTVNISCPNAYGGEPFVDPDRLDALLAKLDGIATKKPVFLKLSPDIRGEKLDAIIAVCDHHRVNGFVCSNLTKEKTAAEGKGAGDLRMKGGLSGRLVQKLSDEQIAYLYKKTSGKYVIIGVGGIFSAEDAFRKIQAGASLLGLVTGMIYEGPQLIGEINRGLVPLLRAGGFSNLAEAVGSMHKS